MEANNNRSQWQSNFGFVISAIGSAVGLGNIWRFPYIMGKNGGGAFLIVYLVLIATICALPMFCELFLGKETKKECIGAYKEISPTIGNFGWLGFLTAIFVVSFYVVVGGWVLKYVFLSFTDIKTIDFATYFSQFCSSNLTPTILSLLFLIICSIVIYSGVNKGIETVNKIAMPIFFVILIGLVIFSLSLPNSQAGLNYMFRPDFSQIDLNTLFVAFGQACFTLSVGMGTLITYGSYINKQESLFKSIYTIITADTLFALLAGLMIFPAVFSFGIEPSSGEGLVFIALPEIFAKFNCGNLISFLFFILLFFAALTSAISILEVPTAALIENFKLSRKKSIILTTSIVAFLATFASLSFGLLKNYKIFGNIFFNFLDNITANYLMPFNTLLACLVVGWFMKNKYKKEFKNEFIEKIFSYILKFVLPLVMIFILIKH